MAGSHIRFEGERTTRTNCSVIWRKDAFSCGYGPLKWFILRPKRRNRSLKSIAGPMWDPNNQQQT